MQYYALRMKSLKEESQQIMTIRQVELEYVKNKLEVSKQLLLFVKGLKETKPNLLFIKENE